MDRAEAALRIAETALAKANAALEAVAKVLVIEGPPGEKGEPGDKGDKGDPGLISAEALADAYKGVWRPGEYERGSIVTFNGSWFLSGEKTAEKPETGKGWQLVVKRGRDGRDGLNGKDGAPGARGPMGRYKGVEE